MTGRNFFYIFRLRWMLILFLFVGLLLFGGLYHADKSSRSQVITRKYSPIVSITPTKTPVKSATYSNPISQKNQEANTYPEVPSQNIGSPSRSDNVSYEIILRAEPTPESPNSRNETAAQPSEPASSPSEEDLIDDWITENDLNRYGDPKDTMYTGGTPLFNEGTGEYTDRLEHIKASNPDSPWSN